MDCVSDRRAVRFTIEPLSTNADGAPVMWGHSEPKTESDLQNIAHPLAASPSSPDIHRRTGTEFPPSLKAKEVTRPTPVVVCLEGRRSRNDWADRCPSPGSPDLCRRPPRWQKGRPESRPLVARKGC